MEAMDTSGTPSPVRMGGAGSSSPEESDEPPTVEPETQSGDEGGTQRTSSADSGVLRAGPHRAAVAPTLWSRLNPAQRDGVRFLYGAYHGAHM